MSKSYFILQHSPHFHSSGGPVGPRQTGQRRCSSCSLQTSQMRCPHTKKTYNSFSSQPSLQMGQMGSAMAVCLRTAHPAAYARRRAPRVLRAGESRSTGGVATMAVAFLATGGGVLLAAGAAATGLGGSGSCTGCWGGSSSASSAALARGGGRSASRSSMCSFMLCRSIWIRPISERCSSLSAARKATMSLICCSSGVLRRCGRMRLKRVGFQFLGPPSYTCFPSSRTRKMCK